MKIKTEGHFVGEKQPRKIERPESDDWYACVISAEHESFEDLPISTKKMMPFIDGIFGSYRVLREDVHDLELFYETLDKFLTEEHPYVTIDIKKEDENVTYDRETQEAVARVKAKFARLAEKFPRTIPPKGEN